jgi:hypothetical protein
MNAKATQTAEELAAEERQAAIARGDIIEGDDQPATDIGEGGSAASEAAMHRSDGDDGVPAQADDAGEDIGVPDGGTADGDAAASAEGKTKPIMIPKARFDEAAQKAKDKVAALQTKLNALEKSHARQTTDADLSTLEKDLDTLEDKYEAHLLEGELDQARAVRHDIRNKRKVISQAEALKLSQSTGNAAVEQIRFDHQLAAVEAKYPQLNPDHEAANPELINEVIEMMQVYQSTGFTATAALQKAVHYIVRSPANGEGKTVDVEAEKNKQAASARTAVAAALAASPPNINKAGKDSDKGGKGSDGMPDVSKMSPAQFSKWLDSDPAAVARMRGDSLSSSQEAA